MVLLKGAALVEVGVSPPGPPTDGRPRPARAPRPEDGPCGRRQPLGYDRRARPVPQRDDQRRLANFHHHFPLVRQDGSGWSSRSTTVSLDDRPELDMKGSGSAPGRAIAPPPTSSRRPRTSPSTSLMHFAFDRINRRRERARPARRLRPHRRPLGPRLAGPSSSGPGPAGWPTALPRPDLRRRLRRVAPPEAVDAVRPAAFTPDRGAAFVRQRVLTEGRSLPLEAL